MKRVVEIEPSIEALIGYLETLYPFGYFKEGFVRITRQGIDERNRWDTFIVEVKGDPLLGEDPSFREQSYLEGPIEGDLRSIIRN
jgi:hypothetical protein